VTPQSRRVMSSGVPSNADIVILSNTASDERGVISGRSWNPGESRRNQGRTSSTAGHSLPRHCHPELCHAHELLG
jgi:hypothetical protein